MTVILLTLAVAKALLPLLLAVVISGAWVYRLAVISHVRSTIDVLVDRWDDRRLAMDRVEWENGRATYPIRVVVRR